MDIPVIARLSDFETSVASLVAANPNLSLQGFWKWGALLLALIYVFSNVASRVKILILHLHGREAKVLSSSEPVVVGDVEFVSSDDEDEDEVGSSCSSEEEREVRDDPASTSYQNLRAFYDDFRVKGSPNAADRLWQKRKLKIRRRRSVTGGSMLSLADLVNGESVVKAWNQLGVELQLEGSSPSISILDLDKNMKIGLLPSQISAASVSPSSPTMAFTASAGGDGRVGLRIWDVRLRRRTPALQADWSATEAAAAVRVKSGGVDKVYVRDDVSGNVRVWDVRKGKSPLTEYDVETRWDAKG